MEPPQSPRRAYCVCGMIRRLLLLLWLMVLIVALVEGEGVDGAILEIFVVFFFIELSNAVYITIVLGLKF